MEGTSNLKMEAIYSSKMMFRPQEGGTIFPQKITNKDETLAIENGGSML
jgi:hypothetical protein